MKTKSLPKIATDILPHTLSIFPSYRRQIGDARCFYEEHYLFPVLSRCIREIPQAALLKRSIVLTQKASMPPCPDRTILYESLFQTMLFAYASLLLNYCIRNRRIHLGYLIEVASGASSVGVETGN